MNRKARGRERLWPNLRNSLGILPAGTEETTKNFSQYGRSVGRDFYPKPHKYEERVLTTQLRRFSFGTVREFDCV